MLRSALVALDGSAYSTTATTLALDWATRFGARLLGLGVLDDEVRQHRPRLLVIGAHGHHPLRDLFASSVTRAVLAVCPVPVFVGA